MAAASERAQQSTLTHSGDPMNPSESENSVADWRDWFATEPLDGAPKKKRNKS
jgi:hypothetical protein